MSLQYIFKLFITFTSEVGELMHKSLSACQRQQYIASKLQCALDLITWWADEWQLSVSVSNILTIGKSQDNRKYCINGHELPHPTQCRDLGITITSDLSPSNHIQQITAKPHQRANSILRCFVSGNISLYWYAHLLFTFVLC